VADLDPAVLGDELMTAIAALRRLIRRRVGGTLPGPRLRGAQVELLHVVQGQPGIGVAVAAKALHLAANSVSTLVNQLTDAGMLIRETDPADRRAIRLHLTEPAGRRLEHLRRTRIELVGAGVAELSTADRQLIAAALPALHALVERLDTGEDER
jgi:DNA-binding MarR family transcriptional regulator